MRDARTVRKEMETVRRRRERAKSERARLMREWNRWKDREEAADRELERLAAELSRLDR